MTTLILRVNAGGQPLGWIPWQDAALLYAKEQVMWTVGDAPVRVYGGTNRASGLRSYLDVHPVVAVKGRAKARRRYRVPPLSNRELFRRDQHMCMYCLATFSDRHLTRDHVVPLSKGGLDAWTNVVTACRACNQKKADRTPQRAQMRLHAVPYAPSYAEWLILHNRRILADQMAFLKAQCPNSARNAMGLKTRCKVGKNR